MAKCLVGANGGGKVTVTGLSSDVILTGNTVKVLQGAKELVSVNGELDILLFGAMDYDGALRTYYWNGTGYTYRTTAQGTETITIPGTFKKAIAVGYGAMNSSSCFVNIGGNKWCPVSGLTEFTSFTNNSVIFDNFGLWTRTVVVIGTKSYTP